MNNIHTELLAKNALYREWHQLRIHGAIHWGAMLGISIVMMLVILGQIDSTFSYKTVYAASNNQHLIDPAGIRITDLGGSVISGLADNNPTTATTISSNGSIPPGLIIDLGATTAMQRVYVTGPTTKLNYWADNYNSRNTPPAGVIIVYVGDTANTAKKVAEFVAPFDSGNPLDLEAEIRFPLATGRYIRLEAKSADQYSGYSKGLSVGWPATPPAVSAWKIGEVEVNGFSPATSNTDAVVWPGYGILSKTETDPLGLVWSDIDTKLVANGWAYEVNPSQLRILVDVSLVKDQLNTVFGTKFSSIYSLLEKDRDAMAVLTTAASDLSYYISQLVGRPVPMVVPENSTSYTGTKYTVVDLKPLAPDYATMMTNIASGALPEKVNIEVSGNTISFKAWPYRNVLESVWEFLNRQGIHWVYPDAHGDFIPSVGTVNKSFLPLQTVFSADEIGANWDAGGFLPWPTWYPQNLRQELLNLCRNGWTESQTSACFGSGLEVPLKADPNITLSTDYTEGFIGYPHNLNSVVPLRILQANPTWCGYDAASATRICSASSPAFDMSNSSLISWVANKMLGVERSYPIESGKSLGAQSSIQRVTSIGRSDKLYNLLPIDATTFDQSPATLALNNPLQAITVPWVYVYGSSQSGSYYNFVNQVATQVKSQNPNIVVGTLAYADDWNPPQNISQFSPNVSVQVAMYGAPNLLTSSTWNSALKQAFESYHSKASHLRTYDYALLNEGDVRIPVAGVAGIVDRAQFLSTVSALNGNTQATVANLPYNPWNFYAYPRIRTNVSATTNQIENDFFNGYFAEASIPMITYYKVLENYQIQNEANLHAGGYVYSVMPGSFPNALLAQLNSYLSQAESAANNWVTKARIAKVRESYNTVVAVRGVGGVDLNNTSSYPAVGQNSDMYSLDLTKGKVLDPARLGSFGSIGASWNGVSPLWSWFAQGALYQSFNFVGAGDYKITISAASIPSTDAGKLPPQADPNYIWPMMQVYVGSRRIGNTPVISAVPNTYGAANASYNNYTYTVNVPAGFGVQDLLIMFRNSANGGARGLFVKSIQIQYLGTTISTAPVTSNQSISTVVNKPASIGLSASDPQSLPLAYSIVTQPSHGSLAGSGNTYVYTPVNNYIGSDSFNWKANNGSMDSNTATVSISVVAATTTPVIPDLSAPTVPTNLTVATNTQPSITLSWNTSTDNIGVTGYNINKNGSVLTSVTSPSYTDNVVTPGTSYNYSVSAFDAAGNISLPSNIVSVTISPATTTPPVASLAIVTSSVGIKTTSTLSISWQTNIPSTGTVAYGIATNKLTSTVVDNSGGTATSHNVVLSGLSKNTKYFYVITAIDPVTGIIVKSAVLNTRTAPK